MWYKVTGVFFLSDWCGMEFGQHTCMHSPTTPTTLHHTQWQVCPWQPSWRWKTRSAAVWRVRFRRARRLPWQQSMKSLKQHVGQRSMLHQRAPRWAGCWLNWMKTWWQPCRTSPNERAERRIIQLHTASFSCIRPHTATYPSGYIWRLRHIIWHHTTSLYASLMYDVAWYSMQRTAWMMSYET